METHGIPPACHLQDSTVQEVEPPPDDQAAGQAPPTQVHSSGPMYHATQYTVLVDYCVRGHVTLHVAFQ